MLWRKQSFIIGSYRRNTRNSSCGILPFTAFNMKATEADGPKVLMFSAIGLLLHISFSRIGA